jgi:hypothetical protein
MDATGIQRAPARALVASLTAVSLAEVRTDAASFLGFWGITGTWLFLALLTCRLDYSRAQAGASVRTSEADRARPTTVALPQA